MAIVVRSIYASLLAFVIVHAQTAHADMPCPAPPSPTAVVDAPDDIFSVWSSTEDYSNELIFHIDLNHGDLILMAVEVLYVVNDRLILAATVETYPLSETQVFGSIMFDPAIAEDVRLTWHYFEPGEICPETKHFVYHIADK